MAEVTWIIHGVIDLESYFKDCPCIGNYHTHGLHEYNNQRELCIVLNLSEKIAKGILNSMGMRVAEGETIFTEGIRNDIIENGWDVQLLSFDGDPTLYIIFPDENGRLPSDDDCDEPFKSQYRYAKLVSEDRGYV